MSDRGEDRLNIQDAIRMAQEDPTFASELVSEPVKFKAVFGLSDLHISALKEIDSNDFGAMQALTQSVDVRQIEDAGASTDEFLSTSSELLGEDYLRAMAAQSMDDIVVYGDAEQVPGDAKTIT